MKTSNGHRPSGRLCFVCVLIVCLQSPNIGRSQTIADTIKLTFDRYMEIVGAHHPMAKAADLQTQKGDATLLKAKGHLDPKLESSLGQKYFDGKQYYSLLDAGLKIPTWYGIDFNAGYDQTGGTFINPEHSTPQGGLVYAGISVPLGAGLFIDERRAAIREAKAFQVITETERRLQLNDLYFKAGKAYWDWYSAYRIRQVYQEAVAVSEARLRGVRQSIEFGDRPAIDTLEAGIQVQNRKLNLQEASLLYERAKASLSLFLWADGKIPMELQSGTIPIGEESLVVSGTLPIDTANLDSLLTKHPALIQYQAKLDQIDVRSEWQKEQLKPDFNLKYNPITEPVGNNLLSNFSVNNYTWGFEFSMPLFLRKERGELKLLDIQSREIDYEREFKKQTIRQLTLISVYTYLNTRQQYLLYNQNRTDYGKLLNGERQMFAGGESSLFMVNSRETAYISAQIELIKTFALHQKAQLEILYRLGTLGN